MDKKSDSDRPPAWQSIQYKIEGNRKELPHISNGGMFVEGSDVFIYEGRIPDEPPDALSSIWKFSDKDGQWREGTTWSHPDKKLPNRKSRGGSLAIPEKGLGVYLGGARIYVNDTSSPKSGEWVYDKNEQLIIFDADGLHKEADTLPESKKRMGAALGYLPIGGKGSVIVIGGTEEDENSRVNSNKAT